MKTALLGLLLAAAAQEDPADKLPLGGDFKPEPVQPAFVAVGHGGRILVSRDDGQSWTQAFFAAPSGDHGPWATKAVAYASGLFVVPIGWGARTVWLASDDAVTWRHLTVGTSKLPVKEKDNPRHMPMTWNLAGGRGAIVGSGYMTMTATPDLGKTFTAFQLWNFKKDPRPRKLVTHHVGTVYCGDATGRFLALGNDRSKEHPVFGNLYASDDLGKTWTWLEPRLLNEKCEGYSGFATNGKLVLILDKAGANVFRSPDAGRTWEGPFPTGTTRVTLNVINGEFWLSGRASRASADGAEWRNLPKAVPEGILAASDGGTLINIDRRRCSILRSADHGESWKEVFAYTPPPGDLHGAQGLRAVAYGKVRRP